MIKSKNKYRHKWVDDGKAKGVEIYYYTCSKCGKKKTKVDSFSAVYYEYEGAEPSKFAPDCVEQLNSKN
jgi:hypothetical protein